MPDTILQRIAGGDSAAVAECLDEYGGMVWSLANRYLKPIGEDPEDAVQEIFSEIWRQASRFDPAKGGEAAFIATVAHRRLTDQQRRAGARNRAVTGLAQNTPPPELKPRRDAGPDAARAVSALEALSPEEREVISLSVMQGLSHERIAHAVNIPVGTVKTRIRRGLIRLRTLLGAAAPEGAR
jgi:RNA polymerase sigma-70 factor, ECF subfamily